MYQILLSLCLIVVAEAIMQGQMVFHNSPPLKVLFDRSDLIAVGSISNGRPAAAEASTMTTPTGEVPGRMVYACQFDFKMKALIKPKQNTSVHQFIWYLPSPTCAATDINGNLISLAVWFLRLENGLWRPTTDSLKSVYPVYSLSRKIQHLLDLEGQSTIAFGIMFLTPGVLTKENRFLQDSNEGQVIDVIGWSGLLEVFQKVFKLVGPQSRIRLCVVAARYGVCVHCAKRGIPLLNAAEQEAATRDLLDYERVIYTEQDNLRKMANTSEEAIIKEFGSMRGAKDEMQVFACSNGARLRHRAITLLRELFQVEEETLPCIPCEDSRANHL